MSQRVGGWDSRLVGPVGKGRLHRRVQPVTRTLAAAGTGARSCSGASQTRSVIATIGTRPVRQQHRVQPRREGPCGRWRPGDGPGSLESSRAWPTTDRPWGRRRVSHSAQTAGCWRPLGRIARSRCGITPSEADSVSPSCDTGGSYRRRNQPRGKLIASGGLGWPDLPHADVRKTPADPRAGYVAGPVSHIEFDPTGRILAASYDGPAGKIGLGSVFGT